MNKNKLTIFVCPLNWGIGHASRMVPVIRELISEGQEVVLGADGRPYDFLKEAFPNLEIVRFPGASIKYPTGRNMVAKMALLIPGILFSILTEHRHLRKLVEKNGFDIIISDNRFGLYTTKAKTVYVTHQLMIKTPWKSSLPEQMLRKLHLFFIKRYNNCWVPDLPGPLNLSGDLSHKYPLPSNASFVGPLSRFYENNREPSRQEKKYKILAIVSGPEPQRTLFEEQVIAMLKDQPFKSAVLRGIPGNKPSREEGSMVIFNHAGDDLFRKLADSSEIILSRPGYSTLMDLAALGRNALVVPTPGQTEQEYLASYLGEKKYFIPIEQDRLSLEDILAISEEFEPLPHLFDLHLLKIQIKSLFN